MLIMIWKNTKIIADNTAKEKETKKNIKTKEETTNKEN